ncbi:MAG: nucleotidyltransferase domain-containing protein [Candidatus Bathyarchaeia archaeon]
MLRKSSNSVKIFFPKYNLEAAIEEIQRTINIFSNRLALERVIIFGSYAKGEYTVASDIDLFIVFDESKCGKDTVYKTLMKNIRLPRLELHILAKKDYEEMKGSRWIREIENVGIDILNIKQPRVGSYSTENYGN